MSPFNGVAVNKSEDLSHRQRVAKMYAVHPTIPEQQHALPMLHRSNFSPWILSFPGGRFLLRRCSEQMGVYVRAPGKQRNNPTGRAGPSTKK